MRQALGFVPRRQVTGGGNVSVNEASGEVTLDFIPTTVTFGTGSPATPGTTDGDTYYDDTLPIYAGYVWRSAAWHQFS